ncbi:hypothetical protein [Mycobacterium sp. DL592]|uniref:hypothetical protein n=1 Tax=Mycobacterium sp. DL592 TaxID=2675524 RepID=UPI00141F016E|nr:hypothetical protein [Mycobacterium sp. DL592]
MNAATQKLTTYLAGSVMALGLLGAATGIANATIGDLSGLTSAGAVDTITANVVNRTPPKPRVPSVPKAPTSTGANPAPPTAP